MSDFNLDSTTDTTPQNDDCTSYGPLLTAFFDGEATREQTRVARAHLEACARCAEAWLGWTHTRYLLRASTVPSPPPSLLLRILMACRLSALPRKARRFGSSSQAILLPTQTVRDFSLTADESALIDAATPAPKIETLYAPSAPSHLHAAILRSTIGNPEFILSPEVVSAETGSTRIDSTQRTSRRERVGAASRRVTRYLPTLAVPALAAWAMFATIQPDQFARAPQERKIASLTRRSSVALTPARVVKLLKRATRAMAQPAAVAQAVPRPDMNEKPAAASAPPIVRAPVFASTAFASTDSAPSQVKATFASFTTSPALQNAVAAPPRISRPFITLASWNSARSRGARTDAAQLVPKGSLARTGAKINNRFEPRHTVPARPLEPVVAAPVVPSAAPTRAVAAPERVAAQPPVADAPQDDDTLNQVRFVVDDLRGAFAADMTEDEFADE